MARFREVDFWPSTGLLDKRWTDEPHTDAWVKSARRVSELYEEALRTVDLDNAVASLRFMTFPTEDGFDAVRVEVHLDRTGSMELARVRVPPSVARLSPGVRGRLVLDVLHGAVAELAPHRGWPPEVIAELRDHVLDRGLRFEWASPWKANPQRSLQARAFFRLEDDGYGRVVLEVRGRRTEELLARSEDALAYSTLAGFRRAAKTLSWVGGNVELVPYVDLLDRPRGRLRLDPALGLRPLRRLDVEAPVGPGDDARPIALTVVGVRAVPDRPTIRIVGGGPANGVPEAYLAELHRCLGAMAREYVDWWSHADRRQLEVWYEFGDGPERPTARRTADKLIARIHRNPRTIRAAHDRRRLAQHDAWKLMEAVGEKMGLGPQPGQAPR